MKKILLSLAVISSLFVASGARAAVKDCDANAIMWCGAYGKTEWAYKVMGGDGHNSAQNLQYIYKSFGVDVNEMKQAVDGKVTKDGRVVVNGKTVATGVGTIGRQYIEPSIKVYGVWARTTQTSLKSDSLDAFVYSKDGVFQWAVIKSCGNVAMGKAVVVPQAPVKPTPPKPTPPAPTPPAPTPLLPETGMEAPMAAALGTTSLGYGLRGYLRSKKQLAGALRRKV